VSGKSEAPDRGDLKSTSYEFFMLAMAILSIANLPLLVISSRGARSRGSS
jgi:hypothetical protein